MLVQVGGKTAGFLLVDVHGSDLVGLCSEPSGSTRGPSSLWLAKFSKFSGPRP